ncbi:carbohydrate-binding module family 1 protein [Calycina marina]|uniref:Carbohydrate-binding module family 1 protein n=1 Tax=Calycina marina TaxID=1763456 RepID=A0A9P7YVZ9_9HELO|nr:carbohydrate-binding module family 1 protein [Calycina marina]
MLFSLAVAALAGSVSSTILWDGRFNDLSTSTDLNTWSWSNQVGPYQYYIHGSSAVTSYINLATAYKNPADSGSAQGAKFTLDSTAYWNGQTMRRTELIPQTTAAINSGKVWYHFSMKRSATNPPSIYREHQINFFESHFTEMKAGWISGEAGTSDSKLQWFVSGTSKWSVNWDVDVWHNVAYEIDFTANTVAFWHSTGLSPLTLTVAAVSTSASSNGADWHLGVLELPVNGQADTTEDYYFSGVYVESGSLTRSVAGPGGVVVSSSSSPGSPVTSAPSSPTTFVTSPTPAGPTSSAPAVDNLAKYSQCGGTDWTGSGICVAGTTCVVTNEWYSQCL